MSWDGNEPKKQEKLAKRANGWRRRRATAWHSETAPEEDVGKWGSEGKPLWGTLDTVLQDWQQDIRAERHLGELNTEGQMQEQRKVSDDPERWQPGYLGLLCFMSVGLQIPIVLGSLNLNLWFLHQVRLLPCSWALEVSSTLWQTSKLPRKNPFWKRCSVWVLSILKECSPVLTVLIVQYRFIFKIHCCG